MTTTIIYDCLDRPEPKASISRFGDLWSITSVSELGELVTRHATFDAAVRAAEDFGFTATIGRNHLTGELEASLLHRPTQDALNALVAAAKDRWAKAKPCYVRYGKLPPDGRSRNHADGSLEAGVSVYRGERLPSGEARAIPSTNAEMWGALRLQLTDRELYIVTGDEIGVGSDGEPLLCNARIWRKAR